MVRRVKNQQKIYRLSRSPPKKADKILLFMLFGQSPARSSETHLDFLDSSSRPFGRTLTVVVMPVFRQRPAKICSLRARSYDNNEKGKFSM
jgi:hypothetical protein